MATFIQVDERTGFVLVLAILYGAAAVLFPSATAEATQSAIDTVAGWLP